MLNCLRTRKIQLFLWNWRVNYFFLGQFWYWLILFYGSIDPCLSQFWKCHLEFLICFYREAILKILKNRWRGFVSKTSSGPTIWWLLWMNFRAVAFCCSKTSNKRSYPEISLQVFVIFVLLRYSYCEKDMYFQYNFEVLYDYLVALYFVLP